MGNGGMSESDVDLTIPTRSTWQFQGYKWEISEVDLTLDSCRGGLCQVVHPEPVPLLRDILSASPTSADRIGRLFKIHCLLIIVILLLTVFL